MTNTSSTPQAPSLLRKFGLLRTRFLGVSRLCMSGVVILGLILAKQQKTLTLIDIATYHKQVIWNLNCTNPKSLANKHTTVIRCNNIYLFQRRGRISLRAARLLLPSIRLTLSTLRILSPKFSIITFGD